MTLHVEHMRVLRTSVCLRTPTMTLCVEHMCVLRTSVCLRMPTMTLCVEHMHVLRMLVCLRTPTMTLRVEHMPVPRTHVFGSARSFLLLSAMQRCQCQHTFILLQDRWYIQNSSCNEHRNYLESLEKNDLVSVMSDG